MSSLLRPAVLLLAALAVALSAAACGQATIDVSHVEKTSSSGYKSDLAAARIFHQSCGGCHTLSVAATGGSGDNPRTYLNISGPNFNVRCERPVTRVLYAIENGGFSGTYMPANIVVGQQAREVAMFVAKFAGRQASAQPGTTACQDQTLGSLPPSLNGGTTGTSTTSSPTGTQTTGVTTTSTTINQSPSNGNLGTTTTK